MQTPLPDRSAARRMVAVADGLDRVIGAVCRAIILVTVIVLLAILGANVVARYVLVQGGLHWVSEVPEQLFPWMIAAGIVLAVQHGAHIAVDIILGFLDRPGKRLLLIGISLLVAAAYVVLLIVALQTAEIAAAERSAILGLPRSLGYYALSFGAAFTAVCSLTVAIRIALIGPEAAPQPNPEESVT
jgi:TRAP-type C4-dicarboxylate transport system permease small subunit